MDTSQPPRGRKPRPGEPAGGRGRCSDLHRPWGGSYLDSAGSALGAAPGHAAAAQGQSGPGQAPHWGCGEARRTKGGGCLCRTQAAWIHRTLAAVWTSARLSPRPWGWSHLSLTPCHPVSVTVLPQCHHSDSLGLSCHHPPSAVAISLWLALSQLPAGSSHVALPGVLSITAQKS